MRKVQAEIAAAREPDFIVVKGAREHNLRIEHLEIPKRKLIVFTGPSGSGKSSLAFDTLYAEGQRRYVETLSAYARQFLGQLDRPAVEHVSGLSPTIAIEQKSASANPRSTVGTITEVYDFLRVLYARAGEQRCTTCSKPVASQSVDEIVETLLELPSGTRATLLAPIVVHRKGEHKEIFEDLVSRGFSRVVVDGKPEKLDSPPRLDKKLWHDISLVADRIAIRLDDRPRIAESVELTLREGKGEMVVDVEGQPPRTFSQARFCCGKSFPELSPASFSFNGPLGMCPACNGLGSRLEVDADTIVPNAQMTIREGAIAPWASAMSRGEGWTYRIADAVAQATGADLDLPFGRLSKEKRELILYGLEGKKISVKWGKEGSESHGTFGMKFEGVIPGLERRFRETTSEMARDHYRKFFREMPCEACGGKRLRSESMAVFIAGKNITDITSMTVAEALAHMHGLDLVGGKARITEGVKREIDARLGFLMNVGLDYLTLDRSGPTLSGGEAQRIRLASQLGSELSGVMYVLDEPSIGLHQRDNEMLIATLRRLRDLGNTVVVVEHDEETIRTADHVVDFGPGAGHEGGRVLFDGTPEALIATKGNLTGDYLAGRRAIEIPAQRREPTGFITIRGAREHNLKNVDARLPVAVLTAVTGVSGAGKSSLINGILLPALARVLHNSADSVGQHSRIDGLDVLDKVIAIDQRPIGRTPRSNPGTYTKAFDHIREIFALLPEARARGWDGGRFSFNVKGGRCESCHGDGMVKVEMHFLADVYVVCEVCKGKRYNAQTLDVRFKGKNINEVLESSVDECLALFSHHNALKRILTTLVDVGLGYMKIGQQATTLSGGEAQRVKLSRELGKTQTGRTLYVLDEPTTGLHFEDIRRLLTVLSRLVDAGNTVVVIEHNLDVIKVADYIVDLGPEGGARGGRIIAEGTPEHVATVKESFTGTFLAKMLPGATIVDKPKAKATKAGKK